MHNLMSSSSRWHRRHPRFQPEGKSTNRFVRWIRKQTWGQCLINGLTSQIRISTFVAPVEATVALLGASQASCVRSLHRLYPRAADNKCRHTELLRKCLRTKAHLAEFPLGSPLHSEAAEGHRFGARQGGFAPLLHLLRAQAPDVLGRSMPDALACDQQYPPESSHQYLRTLERPSQPRPRLRWRKTGQQLNHRSTYAQYISLTNSAKANGTSRFDW